MQTKLFTNNLLKYSAIYLSLCVVAGAYTAISFSLGFYAF
jgi:hypothetical protein